MQTDHQLDERFSIDGFEKRFRLLGISWTMAGIGWSEPADEETRS